MKPDWEDRRHHAEELRRAALAAADPAEAVRRHLRYESDAIVVGGDRFSLAPSSRVFVVGAGKAGVAMAGAVREIVGPRVTAGCVSVPVLPNRSFGPIAFVRGGHPVPDEGTLEAGRRIAALLAETRPEDVVVAVISGGGSALLELPITGIALADLQATTQALLNCGATINELNRVRQRLSRIKGGGLASMAAPATTIGLVLSDVVGDALEVIASGPTVTDASSNADALEVIARYSLEPVIPPPVLIALESRELRIVGGGARASNYVIGSNYLAAQAAVECAESLGFNAALVSTAVEGEAREVGRVVAESAQGVRRQGARVPPPACLVLGGETTVTMRGAPTGRGGRNQELALSAAIALDGWERILVMTLATDGVDGISPAAGAIVTGETVGRAASLGLSAQAALADHDSYSFFSALGDAIVIGPTGTNVNDLLFVLAYET